MRRGSISCRLRRITVWWRARPWLVEEGGLSGRTQLRLWRGAVSGASRGNLWRSRWRRTVTLAATLVGVACKPYRGAPRLPARRHRSAVDCLRVRKQAAQCDYLSVSFAIRRSCGASGSAAVLCWYGMGNHREASSGCYTAMRCR